MLLSVIIPYYNTKKLTRELLLQLNRQKTQDIEIILINDGSDGLEFANEVDVFINKKNAGAAAARNDGIKIARGKYICFIDSDDAVLDNYFDLIMAKIKEQEPDLFWLSWTSPYGTANVVSVEQPNIAAWGCVFKSDIIKQACFNEQLNVDEEKQLWKTIFTNNKNLKIDFIPIAIYNYNIRENSLTRQYDAGIISRERSDTNG